MRPKWKNEINGIPAAGVWSEQISGCSMAFSLDEAVGRESVSSKEKVEDWISFAKEWSAQRDKSQTKRISYS